MPEFPKTIYLILAKDTWSKDAKEELFLILDLQALDQRYHGHTICQYELTSEHLFAVNKHLMPRDSVLQPSLTPQPVPEAVSSTCDPPACEQPPPVS